MRDKWAKKRMRRRQRKRRKMRKWNHVEEWILSWIQASRITSYYNLTELNSLSLSQTKSTLLYVWVYSLKSISVCLTYISSWSMMFARGAMLLFQRFHFLIFPSPLLVRQHKDRPLDSWGASPQTLWGITEGLSMPYWSLKALPVGRWIDSGWARL